MGGGGSLQTVVQSLVSSNTPKEVVTKSDSFSTVVCNIFKTEHVLEFWGNEAVVQNIVFDFSHSIGA
jgi:hypothetical protein